MTYQAVLFDLDGTLLDTIDDLADSMNAVLERFGFPTHDVEPYKYFVGDGVANLARRALPESHRDQNTVDNQIYREYTARVWLEHQRRKEKIGEPDRKIAALYSKTMKTEKTLRRLHKLKKQATTDERKEQIEARIQATIMAYNREYRLRTR